MQSCTSNDRPSPGRVACSATAPPFSRRSAATRHRRSCGLRPSAWIGSDTMQAPVRPLLPGLVARAVLACTGALLALPAFEIGYRLHTQRPVLALDDWRGGRIEDIRFGERGRFDTDLGWAPGKKSRAPATTRLSTAFAAICASKVTAPAASLPSATSSPTAATR